MDREHLSGYLKARLPIYLDLLRDWVRLNSFTRNQSGVNELARRTSEAFAQFGFTALLYPSASPNVGCHLLLSRRGKTDRTIAFVSHLDTVFTAEEEVANHFVFRQEGDRLFGPGVGDIKGGTVLALMVLDALCYAAPEAFAAVTWQVGLNASEEILEPEFSEFFCAQLYGRVLALLVFEPGSLSGGQWPLVVARKGRAQFQIDVEGRGAHAGVDFWQGLNALSAAARLVLTLEAISDRTIDRTVNVGRFTGGTVVNRVPHAATLEGEIRAYTPAALGEGLTRIRQVIDDLVQQGGKGTLAVSENIPPWPPNDLTQQLFSIWQTAGTALGMVVTAQQRGGLSDGNFFWERYPTLDGLGPTGANFHCSEQASDGSKEQEFVLLSSFVPKVLLNCNAILTLLAAEGVGLNSLAMGNTPSPSVPSTPAL